MTHGLYSQRKRDIESAGFSVKHINGGTNAAGVWPFEIPEDYPYNMTHPRVLAWLFYHDGGLLFPKTDDHVLRHYQERLALSVELLPSLDIILCPQLGVPLDGSCRSGRRV